MDKKPILIDSLHINISGGLMILNHFVNRLVKRNIDFVLLRDERCPCLESEQGAKEVFVLSCDKNTRKAFYLAHRNDFRTVFCMGNIPPYIKLDCPVHTFFHNVSMLKLPKDYKASLKLKTWLKRMFISFYASNTDSWIVQTSNTENLVKRYLPTRGKLVLQYPFFELDSNLKEPSFNKRTDYVFVGEYTSAKGHEDIVAAWEKLTQMGFGHTLHMTVKSPRFIDKLNASIDRGNNITNHGFIPHEEVIELYKRCKAMVYPSLNESLGLGVIEAIEAGCDVIGTDLPYLHSICVPSETFKEHDADSIVEAVLRYEKGQSNESLLTIRDMSDELIDFLNKQ